MKIIDFWAKVFKTDTCWIWTGANSAGYGYLWHEGRQEKAHRFAFAITYGPITGDLCVCHTCDNPPCVNPSHLFLGTKQENNLDKMLKGRHRSEVDLDAIKRLVAECRASLPEKPVRTSLITDPDVQVRFWSKVEKTQSCWLWTGAHDHKGYGYFHLNKGNIFAHRFAFQQRYGAIMRGFHVCHRCDTPACVRPEHLFLGTDLDNHADMIRKGRSLRGEASVHAILTESAVLEIRHSAAAGVPFKKLAEQFGVSRGTISDITRRYSWKHLP